MSSFHTQLKILLACAGVAITTAMIQLFLGSDPLIIFGVMVSLAALTLLVVWQPFAFGTWYAAYFFFQLYGIAWFVKTALLIRFESGLLIPVNAIGWSTVFVLMACGLAVAWHHLTPNTPIFEKYFGDTTLVMRVGVFLLALGEIAYALDYVVHSGADAAGSFGGFDPLKRFSLAGTCLLAAAAVARKKPFFVPLLVALGLGVLDTLFYNEKNIVFLRTLAVFLIIMTSGLQIRRKLIIGALLPVVFVIMNALIFPTIHATRASKIRDLPMNERINLVKTMLGKHGNEESYSKTISGNIWNENVNFLPTDNWFLLRFGSVAYFDVTLKFGGPAGQNTSLLAFTGDTIAQAVPLGLMGAKDEFSLADHLWHNMDPRIELGGNITMGAYASARLLFGNTLGFFFTSGLIFLIGILVVRFYGNDIRSPLVMFIFVGIAFTLIDGDLQILVDYIVRFFWQDLFILFGVTYVFQLWHQAMMKAQNT